MFPLPSRWLLCILIVALPVGSSPAQESPVGEPAEIVRLLPPSPADDTPAGLADLRTLLQLQQERTPAQVDRARKIAAQSEFTFGQAVLGDWFTPENLPRTAAIFREIDREDDRVIQAAKQFFNRPRPGQRDARIQPAVRTPHDSSYPSGHTAGAAVWGAILTAAFPEHADGFQAQVGETMWGRELGGVHFPSDTEAGLILGNEIARRLLASPETRKAVEEIRAEAAPFLARTPAPAGPSPTAQPER